MIFLKRRAMMSRASFNYKTVSGIGSIVLENCVETKFKRLMLFGNSAQGENPSIESPKEIKNSGKYDEVSGKYVINVSITGKNLINAVVERGSYSANSLDKVNSDSTRCRVSETVYINKDFVGTLSISGEFQIYVRLFKGTNLVVESGAFTDKYSLNNSNGAFDCLTIVIRKKNNLKIDDIELKGIKIQLEHGSTKTNYEPYKEPQTIALQLDRPLTKWDKIEKRDGIWGIARQGDRKILDGTEEWLIYGNKAHTFSCSSSTIIIDGFCTHYKNIGSDEIGTKTGVYLQYTSSIIITDLKIDNAEEFKAWLAQQKEAGTPVELLYKAKKETWEQLPEEMQLALENLYANDGTTIVSVDSGEVETGIEVEYAIKN